MMDLDHFRHVNEDLRLAVSSRLAIEALMRWHHPDEQVWAAERFMKSPRRPA
jgi:EAL domain-containing protein (putative c-di-GMP-specific phosphodiesterase class I)